MIDFLANPAFSVDDVPNLRMYATFSLENVQKFLGTYGILSRNVGILHWMLAKSPGNCQHFLDMSDPFFGKSCIFTGRGTKLIGIFAIFKDT